MKKALIIVALLSASYSSVQCMDEGQTPLLSLEQHSQSNSPPYQPAASAPRDDQHDQMERRLPQANDVYMTYQEWWDQHKVPADIRSKSMREQEAWMMEKKLADARRQEEGQRREKAQLVKQLEKNINDEKGSCFVYGACAACIVCKLLTGTP